MRHAPGRVREGLHIHCKSDWTAGRPTAVMRVQNGKGHSRLESMCKMPKTSAQTTSTASVCEMSHTCWIGFTAET